MSDYKLFTFNWKIAIPRILIGILLSTVAVTIIVGYNIIYDIKHILLFLMMFLSWTMFAINER